MKKSLKTLIKELYTIKTFLERIGCEYETIDETIKILENYEAKKPKFMQHYWHWTYEDGDWYISRSIHSNFTSDLANMQSGNCFSSYKECEAHQEVRNRLARHIAQEPKHEII